MKKILLPIGIGLLLCLNTVQGQWSYIVTNVATIASQAPTNKLFHLADGTTSSNKVVFISEIVLTGVGASGPATVKLYDWNGKWPATNTWAGAHVGITNYYSNGLAHVVGTRYATNLVKEYITTTAGTNYYTNSGIFTVFTTNAIGKLIECPKLTELYLPESAGMNVTYSDLNLIAAQGILAQVTSNVLISIKYRQMFSPSNP